MRIQDGADLHMSFDVGHSSIGWAVLRQARTAPLLPEILGTGVVTFEADDCLASKRRQNRQARRHARSTRQRIANMERLLVQLGVLTAQQMADGHEQGKGDAFAWQRAADILAASQAGNEPPATDWPALWSIMRWYAHNRGYFAPPWASHSEETADDEVPDTEKVKNAHEKMRELGTTTMAGTIAAYTKWYEREVAKWRGKTRKDKPPHFKGLSIAFPRDTVVWPEMRTILTALEGKLPKLDAALIRTLLGDSVDPLKDRYAWQTIACSEYALPKRYHGGLLFGQLIPRFENRIIGVCPVFFARRRAELMTAGLSSEAAEQEARKQSKLPSKASGEFLRYRWAMQLANVFGARREDAQTRPLSPAERLEVTQQAERQGAMGKAEFKKAVRDVTGWTRDNLDSLLLHPDAEKALVLDPAQQAIAKSKIAAGLGRLPERFLKRLHGKLTHGKEVVIAEIREWLEETDGANFDQGIRDVLAADKPRKGKKSSPLTLDGLLAERLAAEFPGGRAPYSRPVLRQAYDEVMKGWDPRAEKNERQPRGCLCQTEELKEAQLQRRIEEQTNNHLIRHRLLILERLQRALIAAPEYANGKPGRIASLTIEVNRDIRDLSGKSRKEQEQDLGRRMGDFKRVAAVVEEACHRRRIPVTAGWIRKARVAEDLGWQCPYTGKTFSMDTLLDGGMEKDHIIPHADRESDSLDSLVITWKEINQWKEKRTALEFVRDEGGKPVPGRPDLTIHSVGEFKKFVENLDTRKGHDDDRNRKKRRIRRLSTEHYEGKEFTPRDLTVTSALVRLGAQQLQRLFSAQSRPPVISLPGSVTGEVRKAWRLTGCLARANPNILDANGHPKLKQEIRGITHLHHALDACVLGLASLYFPRNGAFWSAMIKAGAEREASDDRRLWLAMTKRRPGAMEAALLKSTGLYRADADGRLHLADLPETIKEQIGRRLAEKRVVQHLPADMSGVRVEENTRGVVGIRNGRVLLRQYSKRDPHTGLRSRKPTDETPGKLLGLYPVGATAKLRQQKGVRIITDNYGVAILDRVKDEKNRFVIIPWHRVWRRVHELKSANDGTTPMIIRNHQLIRVKQGHFAGVWHVFSCKNNASGVALDIGETDVVRLQNKTEGHKINVRLQTLYRDGLVILPNKLTGIV